MCHWNNTPSHGWLHLSPEELKRCPPIARRPDYEEDCEWSIAVVALPDIARQISFDRRNDPHNEKYNPLFPEQTLSLAKETLCNWYPDIYEQLTGEKATPENSSTRNEQKFTTDHAAEWVVICASGDWKAGVPKGYVECIATLGGQRGGYHNGVIVNPEERRYFVLSARYDSRERWGYVIRPDDLFVD